MTTEAPIRAFILEDDARKKETLQRNLELQGALVVGSETSTHETVKLIDAGSLLVPSLVDVLFLDARLPDKGDGKEIRRYMSYCGLLHEDTRGSQTGQRIQGGASPDGIVVVGASKDKLESAQLGNIGTDGQPLLIDWFETDLGLGRILPQVRQLKPLE